MPIQLKGRVIRPNESLYLGYRDVNPIPLKEPQARQYWRNLQDLGMTFENKGHPFQYGHPVEISRNVAEQITKGTILAERLLRESILETGITKHLKSHPMTFAGEVLNYQNVNDVLEKRLREGFHLTILYDCAVAQTAKGPRLQVMELQTTIPGYYEGWMSGILSAAGYDSQNDHATWQGTKNPTESIKGLREQLAQGREITVIHTDLHDIPAEINAMAKLVGGPESLAVKLQDIHWDQENGNYYYNKYLFNPVTGGHVFDEEGKALQTNEKVIITDYISYFLQPYLDTLEKEIPEGSPQRDLILQFLSDAEHVNPIWHPSWYQLADKASLEGLREQLINMGSPYAQHFVEIHNAGEIVPEGEWIKKPTNAYGGVDQSHITVKKGDERKVEEGYIYQSIIEPFSIPIELDPELAEIFNQKNDRERRGSSSIINTIAEVRLCGTQFEGEISGRFIVRLAPFYSGPDSLVHTQNNMKGIQNAVYNYLRSTTEYNIDPNIYERLPFGWCPVIVKI